MGSSRTGGVFLPGWRAVDLTNGVWGRDVVWAEMRDCAGARVPAVGSDRLGVESAYTPEQHSCRGVVKAWFTRRRCDRLLWRGGE